jgi:hypothetical protein
MKPFDICFIDADSLIYRLALKTEISLKLAKTYYDKEIESIQWDTCAEEVKVTLGMMYIQITKVTVRRMKTLILP